MSSNNEPDKVIGPNNIGIDIVELDDADADLTVRPLTGAAREDALKYLEKIKKYAPDEYARIVELHGPPDKPQQ